MISVRSLISQIYQPAGWRPAENGAKPELQSSSKSRKEQHKLSYRQKEAQMQKLLQKISSKIKTKKLAQANKELEMTKGSRIADEQRSNISTSWLATSWEWSKARASKQLKEQERTAQAQMQTKRGADAEVAPEDQLEDQNKEAGEEKERALQELMKQPA
ncbi:cysteine-rich receptor-like protein kinase 10 [Dorcoceras hygrometricum]|uniref:Cysteine-rich receptor-like protein kinase 10 n=1 Tax=Dorcoceras hygrometricum TaxID=472368 RepID=A0A2Z7A7T1_9LAMI|nr:cysteine-rich receptor-like protein kinase 10 [Dorcoceras hygrometricum]